MEMAGNAGGAVGLIRGVLKMAKPEAETTNSADGSAISDRGVCSYLGRDAARQTQRNRR